MDKAVVIDSLGKHLDSLKATISWAILVACLLGFSVLMNSKEVSFLGLDLDIHSASVAAAVFYLFVNLKVAILLFKLRILMQNLTDQDFIEGLNLLASHSFIGNPFGYFVSGTIGRVNSTGPGLLIVAWWVANSSLYPLRYRVEAYQDILIVLFLAMGILSLFAMEKFRVCAMARLKVVDPDLYEILVGREGELKFWTFGGILVGGGIAFLVYILA